MSMWQAIISAMMRRKRWTILLILIALLETGAAMVLCMLAARQEAALEKTIDTTLIPCVVTDAYGLNQDNLHMATGFVGSAALVEPFGDLVDVVARVAQERDHLLQLRQIQLDHQPVQRHLPQERLLIGNADPRHLFLQQPVLLLRQANGDADAPTHELRAHRDGSFAFLTPSAAASGGLLFSLPSTEGLRSCALASSRASVVNRSTSPLWLFTAR